MPAAAVTATLRRQIAEAALTLRNAELSDESIHAARKMLKSARANLRLLRDAVGRTVYARENAVLRDAAKPLSHVRDSKVMLETIDAVVERDGDSSQPLVLVALRGRLEQLHADARRDFEAAQHTANSAAALEAAAKRIGRWRIAPDDASAPRDGLARMHRKVRKALKQVDAEPAPENFHELRKQLKYLRQALATLDPDCAVAGPKLHKRAEALTDALGEDHDLFVLEEHVLARHGDAHRDSGTFFTSVEKRRAKLQARALKRTRKLLKTKSTLLGL